MKWQVACTLGVALVFLGYAIGRGTFRHLDSVQSSEHLQLLIFGCVAAGLVLIVLGILREPRS
ncbi:MAG: hypothetical protein EA418_14645 [Wenzhouxiangellaceae bacterium]|nr:MAG: hypothetical protein EA418_14645 [Wenzhouxiangellaceae bacterium]